MPRGIDIMVVLSRSDDGVCMHSDCNEEESNDSHNDDSGGSDFDHLKTMNTVRDARKVGLFKSIQNQIPDHFVYQTRFSRTLGKSFLLPQCRTDVFYVSDPCEHPDHGERDILTFSW